MGINALDKDILYPELSYAVIGAAMETHRVLGSGFTESVYELGLAHEFDLRHIAYERQVFLNVHYKGVVIGNFRADFVVDNKIILELKAIKMLTRIEEGQLMNYLKATGLQLGILLNFGAPSLQHERLILRPRPSQ